MGPRLQKAPSDGRSDPLVEDSLLGRRHRRPRRRRSNVVPVAVSAFGMQLKNFAPGADYRYAMGMGASLMLGWTALLIWADRKPIERRGHAAADRLSRRRRPSDQRGGRGRAAGSSPSSRLRQSGRCRRFWPSCSSAPTDAPAARSRAGVAAATGSSRWIFAALQRATNILVTTRRYSPLLPPRRALSMSGTITSAAEGCRQRVMAQRT